jgi:hypothetical protein
MTITTTAYKTTVSGNGATTTFSYSFEIPGANSTDQSNTQLTYVDASGNSTVIANSLWSITGVNDGSNGSTGGSFTYPLTGSPIASCTTLTLARVLPLEQLNSMANQGALFPSAVEKALDWLMMVTQQVNGLFSRALVAPLSDANPPSALPSATARANQLLGFDGNGNPIAAQPSSALVSTAMQPVVSAASLALGRTAFGLGALATENIGSGLQDDGAGNLRVVFTPVSDATNQSVTAAFHNTERQATGTITYTLAKSSTLFAGFGFTVYALTGNITFAINAADAFNGMATGVSLIIPPGSHAFVSTDGAGTWNVSGVQALGLQTPLNVQLNGTVSSNALTIAVKDRNGNDPSKSSPVIIPFRDPTIANGDPVFRALGSGLSITVPNGATLGTANAIPFRVWVVIFDNAGTLVLGVIVCVVGGASPTQIVALPESSPQSGTGISAGSTSAGVFYSASAVTTKSFRVLGYMDFSSGQVTAGTWATAPDKIQLFGAGQKKPGDVVQSSFFQTTSDTSSTSTSYGNTAVTKSITPTSAPNLVKIALTGSLGMNGAANGFLAIGNGSTQVGPAIKNLGFSNSIMPAAIIWMDNPNTSSSVTYTAQIKTSNAANAVNFPGTSGGSIVLEEIMA